MLGKTDPTTIHAVSLVCAWTENCFQDYFFFRKETDLFRRSRMDPVPTSASIKANAV